MHVPRTPRFDDERVRFALRFTCDECSCFDAPRERCRHGWPTEAHRGARYAAAATAGDQVVFCKEFEVP